MTEVELFPHEKSRGRRRYLAFCRLNAVSITCSAENLLVLYALRIGLPESMVGFLGSLIYIALPFALLGRMVVSRIGATRTIGLAWLMRNALGLMMIAAPWVTHVWGLAAGLAVLLTGSFGFFVFRSIGAPAWNAVVAEITNEGNRGRFTSQMQFTYNLSVLLATAAQVLAIQFADNIGTFQVILLVGCLTGFLSVTLLRNMPESEAPRLSARLPIRRAVGDVLGDDRMRKLLLAYAAGNSIIIIVIPLSLAALKQGYDVAETVAFLYLLAFVLGGIGMSFLNGVIAEHTGPRPLVILSGLGFLVVCLMWLFAPDQFHWAYVAAIFLLSGAAANGMAMGLSHSFLVTVPQELRITSGLMVNVIAGAGAGLAGTVIGSGLIKALQGIPLEGMPLYRTYFGLLIVVMVPLVLVLMQLERVRDWSVQSVLGLLASPRDLRVLYSLSRLTQKTSPKQDFRHLGRLSHSASDHSEPGLLDLMDSPDFRIRADALQGFRQTSIGPEARRILIRQLQEGVYTVAYIAADILGMKRIRQAIPELRKAMEAGDFFLQSKCMVALARMRDEPSYPKILDAFRQTDNPRLQIHGAVALREIGRPEHIRDLLAKAQQPMTPPVRRELLYSAAVLAGCGDELYAFLKTYSQDPTEALSLLAETDKPERSAAPPGPLKEDVICGRVSVGELTEQVGRMLEAFQGKDPVLQAVRAYWRNDRAPDLPPEMVYCLWQFALRRWPK